MVRSNLAVTGASGTARARTPASRSRAPAALSMLSDVWNSG